MTPLEAQELVGRTGTVQWRGISIHVKIVAIYPMFGRYDCLIEPIGALGRETFNLKNIKLDKEQSKGKTP